MKQSLSSLFALIPNLGVAGSSPAGRAIQIRPYSRWLWHHRQHTNQAHDQKGHDHGYCLFELRVVEPLHKMENVPVSQLAPAYRGNMLRDLQLLGVTDFVAFPDLDSLATELKTRFS